MEEVWFKTKPKHKKEIASGRKAEKL